MNKFGLVVVIWYLSAVESSFQPHSDIQLQSVPDISSYGKTMYPQQRLYDLGEHAEIHHTPEIVKIIKTLQVEVPKPYPVHVPHNVPVPVPFKVPHIIKVPHVVKVAQPVPVEVVKHVPVHQQQEQSSSSGYGQYDQSSGYSAQDAFNQISNLAHGGEAQQQFVPNYGPQSFDQGSQYTPQYAQYGSTNDAQYGTGDSQYNAQDASSQNYAVTNSYPSNEQQISGSDDHTAQASNSQGTMQQQSQMAYVVGAHYQVKDNNESN